MQSCISRARFAPIIFAALVVLACVAPTIAAEDERLRIAGSVESHDGAPVPNARVRLVPLPLPKGDRFRDVETFSIDPVSGWDAAVASARTGDKGTFVVEPDPVHLLFQVVITAPGFAPQVIPNFALRERGLLARLDRGYSLEGKVLSLDCKPVAGAAVIYRTLIEGGRIELRATSAGDGRYEFSNLPFVPALVVPEDATLEVRATGFAPQVRPVAFGVARAAKEGESQRRTLDVYLARGGNVRGVVTDSETAAPIAGARVILWSEERLAEWRHLIFRDYDDTAFGVRVVAEAMTDAEGKYALEHVPVEIGGIRLSHHPGVSERYKGGILVLAPGYVYGEAGVPIFRSDRAEDSADFDLVPGAAVIGRLLDDEQQPVAGARVGVSRDVGELAKLVNANVKNAGLHEFRGTDSRVLEHFETWRSVTTNSSGAYRIDGIPCPGEGPSEVSLRAHAARDRAASMNVRIERGRTTSALDLILEFREGNERFKDFGIVRDGAGNPLAGVQMMIVDPESGFCHEPVFSSQEGRCGLRNFETNVLRASHPGFGTASILLAAADVKAPARETAVTLLPEKNILGVVEDSAKRGVPGVLVYAYVDLVRPPDKHGLRFDHGFKGFVSKTVTGADGKFVIRGLAEGRYHLLISHEPPCDFLQPAFAVERIRFIVADVEAGSVEVAVTMPQEYVASRGHLTLWVIDPPDMATGPGAFGFRVSLMQNRTWPMPPLIHWGERVGPGRWEFFDVPPGKYDVSHGLGLDRRPVEIKPGERVDFLLDLSPKKP